jgi:hypothetical protein
MKARLVINAPARMNNVEKKLGLADQNSGMGEGSIHLHTDSQDVQAVKDHLGNQKSLEKFNSFFTIAENGDYTHIYGCTSSVPASDALVYKCRIVYSN